MPIHIRDAATDRLARRLAAKSGTGLTEAIRTGVEHEPERLEAAVPLSERVAAIRRRIASRLRPPAQTDKNFFDDLSEDERCLSTLAALAPLRTSNSKQPRGAGAEAG